MLPLHNAGRGRALCGESSLSTCKACEEVHLVRELIGALKWLAVVGWIHLPPAFMDVTTQPGFRVCAGICYGAGLTL